MTVRETRWALQLLRAWLHGRRAPRGPLSVNLDITRRCNLRCLGCPYHSAELMPEAVDETVRDISLELVERLGQELASMGTASVIIAGTGEPLLHRECGEIVSILKRLGLEVCLYTNGILLEADRARALLEAGLDRLIVNLWAHSPQSYELCHPGASPDAFERVVANIGSYARLRRELKRRSSEIFILHVFNVHNHGHLDAKIELAINSGCDGLLFGAYLPPGEGADPAALSADQIAQVKRSLPAAARRLSARRLKHNVDALFLRSQFDPQAWQRIPCYVGWYQSRIRVDGAVMPCASCDIILGDLNQRGFGEIWRGRAYQELRNQAETRAGLKSLSARCRCDWCCYFPQNYRLHRVLRWLAPVFR